MKRFVSLEESISKQVGKRLPADPLQVKLGESEDARAWTKYFGGIPVERKGVYCFRTHEEADQWLWKKITSRRQSRF